MLHSNQLSLIILLIIIGTTLYFLSESSSNKAVKNEGEMEVEAEAESEMVEMTEEDGMTEEETLSMVQEEAPVRNMIQEEEERIRQVQAPMEEQVQETKSNALDSYFENSGENDLNRNTFGPNDSGSIGADLSTAYENPLPGDSCRDCIDFSKNKQREYKSSDYLPQDVNDEWFETDFSNAKYQVDDDKLINTDKYVVGINTVGQSLKNPSYDIRGTIPNPKVTVSPWNQSTIEPDFNLKSLV
jgi:hypothetical protein